MSTQIILPPPPHPPSPSKTNPFARPLIKHHPSSFTRQTLLPNVSPVKQTSSVSAVDNGISTPTDNARKPKDGTDSGSVGRGRQGWRLLWRGGLEIGEEGWRLEGITFFALLNFAPVTPSVQPASNPFDVPIQDARPSVPSPPVNTSPFPLLQSADTDLCLSLESMRGRKYLQVRGLVDLPADEQLDGGRDDAGGVQMSIAPTAPLLASYFAGLLCRQKTLSPQGRTLSAIQIGLGDEGVDSPSSAVLVYGQLNHGSKSTLRLCVGRRRPPPPAASEKKVRPGEPLPRAPLFFPSKASKNPPPPFPPRRRSSSRSFSRAPSVNSIYQHPQHYQHQPDGQAVDSHDHTARKRPRSADQNVNEVSPPGPKSTHLDVPASRDDHSRRSSATSVDDEDIFGRRAGSVTPRPRSEHLLLNGIDDPAPGEGSSSKNKRVKVPQQTLDNKASIRKQTLLLMEERGYPRDHSAFKDVFGMTSKGTNFAFRDHLEFGPISKSDIRGIVIRHLEMYLPNEEEIVSEVKPEVSIMVDDEEPTTNVTIGVIGSVT